MATDESAKRPLIDIVVRSFFMCIFSIEFWLLLFVNGDQGDYKMVGV